MLDYYMMLNSIKLKDPWDLSDTDKGIIQNDLFIQKKLWITRTSKLGEKCIKMKQKEIRYILISFSMCFWQ